ncbi:MAG: LamG-like jellyroll fold domain-containing protein [Candidatus Paceibacterota bacterium]
MSPSLSLSLSYRVAFTLIELLVVIAIIGILSGLIVVSMSGVTKKATIAKAQVFSNSLRNSLMMNIVGEWKFDGSTADGTAATDSDVLDTWGNVNDGNVSLLALANRPIVKKDSNCVSGSCLSFDGGDYVDCKTSDSLNVYNVFTVEAWIKPNVYSNFMTWVARQGDAGNSQWRVTMGNTGTQWGITWHNGTVYRDLWGGALNIEKWNHVVIVVNGNNQYFYRDGLLEFPKTQTNDIRNLTNRLTRIGYQWDNTAYFNGSIDNVRIYNVAIPTSQIKEQYYTGLNKLFANGGITQEEYSQRLNGLASK